MVIVHLWRQTRGVNCKPYILGCSWWCCCCCSRKWGHHTHANGFFTHFQNHPAESKHKYTPLFNCTTKNVWGILPCWKKWSPVATAVTKSLSPSLSAYVVYIAQCVVCGAGIAGGQDQHLNSRVSAAFLLGLQDDGRIPVASALLESLENGNEELRFFDACMEKIENSQSSRRRRRARVPCKMAEMMERRAACNKNNKTSKCNNSKRCVWRGECAMFCDCVALVNAGGCMLAGEFMI